MQKSGINNRCTRKLGNHRRRALLPCAGAFHNLGTGRLPIRLFSRSECKIWDKARNSRDILPRPVTPLKQAANGYTQHTQRALVFETLGCLVNFLQGYLGVSEQRIVIDKFANCPMPLINFLQNFPQVRR